MAKTRFPKGRTRGLTVAALLGIFVGAVVLAVLARFVPGRLARLGKKPDVSDRS